MAGFHTLSWKDLHQAMEFVAEGIKTSGLNRTGMEIVPVVRGGLIPGTILSHILQLPIKDVVYAQSYKGQERSAGVLVTHSARLNYNLDKCIFVEDIVDTGNTIMAIRDSLPQARFVAPVSKPEGLELVRGAMIVEPPITVEQSTWVNYPWEVQTR